MGQNYWWPKLLTEFNKCAKKKLLGLRWARAVCALSRPNLCLLLLGGLGLGVLGRMRLTPKVSLDPALSSAEAFQPVTTKTYMGDETAPCDFENLEGNRWRK